MLTVDAMDKRQHKPIRSTVGRMGRASQSVMAKSIYTCPCKSGTQTHTVQYMCGTQLQLQKHNIAYENNLKYRKLTYVL